MLVAVVLVTEPFPAHLLLAHQQRGVVGQDVVRVAQAHGDEDRGGVERGEAGAEHGRHVARRGPIGGRQVLVVGEVEPAVVRPEDLECGQILFAPRRHDIVARREPPRASHSEGTSG